MTGPKNSPQQVDGKNDVDSYLKNNPDVAKKCKNAVAQWKDDVSQEKASADLPTTDVLVCSLGGGDTKPRGKGR